MRLGVMAMAMLAALAAGVAQAAPEARCPTDPLAPAVAPVVQLDTRPAADGMAAAVGGMQYHRVPGLGPKDIALTFDDGPNPDVTPKVLHILAQHCIKASFFLVGIYARARPDLVRQEAAAGHVIGAHTYTHPDNLRRLDVAAAESEIARGFKAVQDSLAGAPEADRAQLAPFFRFPGLNDSRTLMAWLGQRQTAVVGADIGADDWKRITPDEIQRRAVRYAVESGGGILILHDTHPHTAEALPGIIAALEARGFRFVQLAPAPGARERAAAAPGALIGPPPVVVAQAASEGGSRVRVLADMQGQLQGWAADLLQSARQLASQWAQTRNP